MTDEKREQGVSQGGRRSDVAARQIFRQQALDARRDEFLGEIAAYSPVSSLVLWVVTASLLVAALLFLFLVDYSRRERVEGFVTNGAGAYQLSAGVTGIVNNISASEGAFVDTGQEILSIRTQRGTREGTTSLGLVDPLMQERIDTLDREIAETEEATLAESRRLRGKIASLTQALGRLSSQRALYAERVESAKAQLDKYNVLRESGYLSALGAAQKHEEFLEQQIRLQTFDFQVHAMQREMDDGKAELAVVAARARASVERLRRQRGDLKQEQVERTIGGEDVIRAPAAGRVSNLAVSSGDSVSQGHPVAVLLPVDAKLGVRLLVPSRAIGQMRVGQTVLLRYAAFPYQKFGQYKGVIQSISGTVVPVGERLGPIVVQEPQYSVHVSLEQQNVSDGANNYSIKPGMTVLADVLLQPRTLASYLFEPILAIIQRRSEAP